MAISAWLLSWLGLAGAPFAPREPCIWLTDSAAGKVYALDERFEVALEIPGFESPDRVEATEEGGAWVAESEAPGIPFSQRLVRLAADGTPIVRVPGFGWVADLSEDPRTGLLWVADGYRQELSVVDSAGGAVGVFPIPYVQTVEATGRVVYVGTGDGRLILLDPRGVETREVLLGGSLTDIRRAGSGGDLWALDVDAPGWLIRLDSGGAEKFRVKTQLAAEHFAALRDGSAWIPDMTEPFLRRYGPDGATLVTVYPAAWSGFNLAAAHPRKDWAIFPAGSKVLVYAPDGALVAEKPGFQLAQGISTRLGY